MFSLKFSAPPRRKTLHSPLLEPLPLGAIKPTGWLRDQLRVQAEGLSGHLDEFWPSVADSRWIGGAHEGWERGPYWLDGLIPLAILLGDERLFGKAQRWIDYILAHQHEDGWLGPKEDPHEGTGEIMLDPWPQFVLFKALTQWQEATGDERIIPAMLRATRCMHDLLLQKPLHSWGRMRWADLVVSLHWLYVRSGEDTVLELAALAKEQGYDWRGHFESFRATELTDPAYLATLSEEDCLPLHGVNNAMGVKSGAVWSRQSGDLADAWASLRAIELLDEYHGQVTGMFSGDEHLAGRNPIQGTETCTVTEYLYTLEQIMTITGEPGIADKMEQIAFNALPAALTKDMWARQYDQQPNQVLCSVDRRDWVSNGAHSNLFSLEGNFGCCTANFHQGWPKFVSHLWMTPRDGKGLVAIAYSPSTVSTRIDGIAVTLEEVTDYPFRGEIRFTVRAESPVAFTLYLRIPGWAEGATVTVEGDAPITAKADTLQPLERVWREGDRVTLRLPMVLRWERRFNDAVSLLRGPLVMSLRIGEEFRQIGGVMPQADWEVHPTTPWNFGLILDENGETSTVRQLPLSGRPFDPQTPPVMVTASAFPLSDWEMTRGSAALPDTSPTAPVPGDITTVELVPYGSTHLRISEFPAVVASSRSVAGRPYAISLDIADIKPARFTRRFTRRMTQRADAKK